MIISVFLALDDFSFLHTGEDLVESMNQSQKISSDEMKLKSFPNETKDILNEMKIGEKDGIGFQFTSNGSVGHGEDCDNINGTGKLFYNDDERGILFNGTFINGKVRNGVVFDLPHALCRLRRENNLNQLLSRLS